MYKDTFMIALDTWIVLHERPFQNIDYLLKWLFEENKFLEH